MSYWLIGGGAIVLIMCLFAFSAALLIAFSKKRVDNRQEELARVGHILEDRLKLKGAAPIFAKLGSGNLIGAYRSAKEFSKRWFNKKAIDNLIERIIRKATVPLIQDYPEHRVSVAKTFVRAMPILLDDKDAERILEPALMERIAGFKLDNVMKAELAVLVGVLNDWGLEKTSMIISAMSLEDGDMAKVQIQAILAELRTDDGRRTAAKRVLRKLVPEFMEKPEDAAYLVDLVNKNASALSPSSPATAG